MLAVSLKWRLGVVRRRPKGTAGTGIGQTPLPAPGLGGWTCVWREAEGPRGTSSLGLSSLPCLSLLCLDLVSCAFWVSLQF